MNDANRRLGRALSGAFLCTACAAAPAVIGDDDGFGGTQGPDAIPGDAFVNFMSPSISPGTHLNEAGTDVATLPPYAVYIFELHFSLDLSDVPSIYSAELMIQSGSVARGVDRGFGHARVLVGGVDIGPLLTESTGASGSAAEENVKAHRFDVTDFVTAGEVNEVTVVIDGSPALAVGDLFAFDFARLSVRRSCPGDVTIDGYIDFGDLNLVLSNFLDETDDGDSDGDGVVDFADLNEVLSNYITFCPDPR